MKSNKFIWAVGLAALAWAGATALGQTNWTGLSGADVTDWHDAANWDTGVPDAGNGARFVNRDGATINLYATDGMVQDLNIWGCKPFAIQGDPGTTLSFRTMDLNTSNGGGGNNTTKNATFDIDLIGSDTITQWRKSTNFFFNRNVTLANELRLKSSGWHFGDGVGTDTFTFNGGLNVTFQSVNSGSTLTANMNGTVVAPNITVGAASTYNAMTTTALGDSSTAVTVRDGGQLNLDAAQTVPANISVDAFSLLAGDLTGADYADPDKNVTLAEDAILAPSAGPEPTLTDLGATKIWKGAVTTGTTTAGNPATTAYKGIAVGNFTTGLLGASNTFTGSEANDLELIVVTNNTATDVRGATLDSDTGVANVYLAAASGLKMINAFQGTATEIHVRNLGPISKRICYIDEWGVPDTHQIHVHDGEFEIRSGREARILGTVELHGDAMWDLGSSTPIVANDDTRFVLNDDVALQVGTGEEGALELLTPGTNLIVNSPKPVVYLTNRNGGYDFTGAAGGIPNPVMVDLLLASDVCISSNNNNLFELNENLTLGDGRYLINYSSSHKGITIVDQAGAPGILSAPAGASSIGFAQMGGSGTLKIDVAIDGSGAKVLFGSTAALAGVRENNLRLTEVITGTVELNGNASFINTPEVSIESGALKLNAPMTFPDLTVNATLNANNNLATVTGTLSGNGTVIGGNGVVVEDGGTFAWEVSDPDGDAATGWNVLWTTSLIDFDLDDTGTVNFAPVDAGIPLGKSIELADEFVVAAHDNGVIDMPGAWAFVPTPGWGLDAADLSFVEDYADVDGDADPDDCLVLSNVTFWPAAPMTWSGGVGDWAAVGNWTPDGPPLSNSQVTVGTAGDYATIDAPAAAASLDVTEGTVDVQSTLDVGQAVTVAAAGTLIVDGALTAADVTGDGMLAVGGTLTAADVICNGTLSGSGTIHGAVIAAGVVAPGPDATGLGAATLIIDGSGEFGEQSEYVCEIDGLSNDQLIFRGQDTFLGGTLTLVPRGVDASQIGTTVTRSIVSSQGEAALMESFATVPPSPDGPADPPSVGHLGLGVFHRGVTYVEEVGAITSVDVELEIARGGDGNADGNVDGQDIQTLIINFNVPGDPADRNWLDNDTAGGEFGRGDGFVDGQDITDLITNFTGDGGPTEPGTARAEYNRLTNEWKVSVENVMSWTLISEGQFIGSEANGAYDSLFVGGPPNLVSANANTIGEGSFATPMTYADVRLGQLIEPDTAIHRITLQYVSSFGGEKMEGTIHVVPQPSTLILLCVGAAGLAGYGWRRRRRS